MKLPPIQKKPLARGANGLILFFL